MPETSNRRKNNGLFTRRAAFRTTLLPALFSFASTLKSQSCARGDDFARNSQIPWKHALGQLVVADGPFKGAFRSVPNGSVNWYFANLGLRFFVPEMPDAVRDYLNCYLRSLDSHDIIADIAPGLTSRIIPDSHDAYAGTFLSLAVRYTRTTNDLTWWRANLRRLKAVAYSNLLTQVKKNGLVRAFQSPHQNGNGYLMDQCEVYAGLREFGQYLIETDDAEADYFAGFAMYLGIAIHRLFNSSGNFWNWCDTPAPRNNAWYPNVVAQIYPHLYDVHSDDAPSDYARLHRGFEIMRSEAPDWASRPRELSPWLVAGYYATSCMNENDSARAMLSMALKYYMPGSVNSGRMLISDLGYARGIIDTLSS